ncbi:MAG: hypothetical protein GIW95_00570 [Candidatus Eremiobacteraeota bacterium]|nr:hypothetical protein [Candidatus Eremiobacteraeota bacterium]
MSGNYIGLRDQALRSARSDVPGAPLGRPWGVVADLGLKGGTATIVALADGHASMYFSSGAGYIGGGQKHQRIRDAARIAVEAGIAALPLLESAAVFPLPPAGRVTFFVLTDKGVVAASGVESELVASREKPGPLAVLYLAIQNVITQYRLTQQSPN